MHNDARTRYASNKEKPKAVSYLQNFKFDISGPENGPRLVFLHGVMGSLANWRRVVPGFVDKYRVLSFDQRGHGRSFKPEKGYSPEDYASDLNQILIELDWSQVNLVGHSMGGRNAIEFASTWPDKVLKLVVEDIGPQGNPAAMQKTIDMVKQVPVPFTNKLEAKRYFEEDFVIFLGGGESARVLGQYFYTNIETKEDGSANWRFARDGILDSIVQGHATKLWDQLERLPMPTFFIRGEKSQDFPREEFSKVLKINPNISGIEILDSGHWVHFDQPDQFIEVTRKFLDG